MKRFAAVSLALLVFPRFVSAQDTERLSYKAISSALQANYAEASQHAGAQIRLVAVIESKRPNVDPQQIVLTLHHDDKHVRIPVKADGSFELPTGKKWEHEDAWIETNQPVGALKLSLQGHIHLGNLSMIEKGGFCTLTLLQLFPSDAIAKNAREKLTGLFPRSRQKITMPAFTSVQLRNDGSTTSRVRVLAGDTEFDVEKGLAGTFRLRRTLVESHPEGLVKLQPTTGWRWRVKPEGLPWTSWVDISAKCKEAE